MLFPYHTYIVIIIYNEEMSRSLPAGIPMGRAVEKFVKLNQIICEESITLRKKSSDFITP